MPPIKPPSTDPLRRMASRLAETSTARPRGKMRPASPAARASTPATHGHTSVETPIPHSPLEVMIPEPSTGRELAALVERANAQLGMLRQTMTDAARTDQAARATLETLESQVGVLNRACTAIDARLVKGDAAAKVLAGAKAVLERLDSAVERLRTTHEGVTGLVEKNADEQKRRVLELVEQEQQRFEAHLAALGEQLSSLASDEASKLDAHALDLREKLENAGEEARATLESAAAEASASLEALGVRVAAEADDIASRLAQRLAEVRGESEKYLEDAGVRLSALREEAQSAGVTAREVIDSACERAHSILGIDPRRPGSAPAADGLLAVVGKAEGILHSAESSGRELRGLAHACDRVRADLSQVVNLTAEQIDRQYDRNERVRTLISEGEQVARRLSESVEETADEAAAAVAEAHRARDELLAVRAELEETLELARRGAEAAGSANEALRGALSEVSGERARAEAARREADEARRAAEDAQRAADEARLEARRIRESVEQAADRLRALDEREARVASLEQSLASMQQRLAQLIDQAERPGAIAPRGGERAAGSSSAGGAGGAGGAPGPSAGGGGGSGPAEPGPAVRFRPKPMRD